MKLDYFSLLSPLPYYIDNVGSVKSPTLREISKLGYSTYQYLVSNLLISVDSYYKMINDSHEEYLCNFTEKEKENILHAKTNYEKADEDIKHNTSIYSIIMLDNILAKSILCSLKFFFEDEITYNIDTNTFLLFNGSINENNEKVLTGVINEKNYNHVIDIILQRLNISRKQDEYDNVKTKNKIAENILKKLRKANKKNKTIPQKDDPKMEFGNIISSISSHSKTLNILNVWDLTVFQLYDQFTRIKYDDLYIRNSISVSIWGDSENKFDETIWFLNINKD